MAAAKTYLMDPTITLTHNAVVWNCTSQVSAVEIAEEATVLKRTTFGNTWDRNGRGLKRGTIKLDFYVDFDANGVYEKFKAMWEHATIDVVAFEVEEAGGAGVTGSFVLSAMPTFAGAADEYNVASLTFTLDGAVTHAERP